MKKLVSDSTEDMTVREYALEALKKLTGEVSADISSFNRKDPAHA